MYLISGSNLTDDEQSAISEQLLKAMSVIDTNYDKLLSQEEFDAYKAKLTK